MRRARNPAGVGEEPDMALKFAGTMNAINRGLEGLKPAQAVHMIEDWEAALAEIDVPGAKGIARDLAALRTQLEKPEPSTMRVLTLLFRLGEATVRISARAEKNQEKINALGEALHEAGDEDPDEAEDTEAAAAPKRRGSRGPKK
jgi:phosphotransferase system HPr-like phosphotransfer protein